MESNKHRLQNLLESDVWTDEDRLWLISYLEHPENDELYSLALEIFRKDLSDLNPQKNLLDKNTSENILARLHKRIDTTSIKKSSNFQTWAVAASLALMVISAGLLFYTQKKEKAQTANTSKPVKIDIAPAANKASLTLADGSTIFLDSSREGEITKQGNSLVKNTRNVLSYSVRETASDAGQPVTYNTLTTPRGGQYRIILPDNTVVWLNAASSLRFPTSFSGKERKVELIGEAYFEVTKNKAMPFKVSANNTEVQVLGTHFNIMAYADESSINTTLLEGSVKIIKDNKQTVLIPGQQARVKNNIRVSSVDVSEAIAWKNGLFQFKDAKLETILRQIARWYDVEVEFTGKIPDERFRAEVSRNANLSQVLKILEVSGVNFTINEGRKIIVTP